MDPKKFNQIVSEVPDYKRRLFHRQGRIANQVRAFLKERGKTQTWLAEESGVALPVVSRVMMGTSNLTLETIAKLESALKIDIQLTPIEYEEARRMVESVPTKAIGLTGAVRARDINPTIQFGKFFPDMVSGFHSEGMSGY